MFAVWHLDVPKIVFFSLLGHDLKPADYVKGGCIDEDLNSRE